MAHQLFPLAQWCEHSTSAQMSWVWHLLWIHVWQMNEVFTELLNFTSVQCSYNSFLLREYLYCIVILSFFRLLVRCQCNYVLTSQKRASDFACFVDACHLRKLPEDTISNLFMTSTTLWLRKFIFWYFFCKTKIWLCVQTFVFITWRPLRISLSISARNSQFFFCFALKTKLIAILRWQYCIILTALEVNNYILRIGRSHEATEPNTEYLFPTSRQYNAVLPSQNRKEFIKVLDRKIRYWSKFFILPDKWSSDWTKTRWTASQQKRRQSSTRN